MTYQLYTLTRCNMQAAVREIGWYHLTLRQITYPSGFILRLIQAGPLFLSHCIVTTRLPSQSFDNDVLHIDAIVITASGGDGRLRS